MANKYFPEGLIIAKYADLVAAGIVGSRFQMREQIAKGRLRPPHKDGDAQQAAAFWFVADLEADLDRKRGIEPARETAAA